jgi:hypothetical protein
VNRAGGGPSGGRSISRWGGSDRQDPRLAPPCKRLHRVQLSWQLKLCLVECCFPYNTIVTKQADLIAYLFEGQPRTVDLLSGALLQWMGASSRFTDFVETYRDKIRKKIRVTREPESVLDLRGELEVAYCLLGDRRLAVAYEPYASAKRRGPDFAVTYRANLVFNVEVARVRVEEKGVGEIDLPRKEERILRILLDKLGQMQPGMANLLVIHTREELARSIDLGGLMQEVKTRVETKDPSFYSASRYSSPAAFYKDFLHLNGILLWVVGAQLWVNRQARPALPGKVFTLVSSLPPGASSAFRV